jgi:hypothetical protein
MKKFATVLITVLSTVFLGGCFLTDKIAEEVTEKAIENETGSDVELDTEDGGVSVETDEGEMNIGSKANIPDNFPSDIPLIDYSEILNSAVYTDDEDGTTTYQVMITSEENFEDTLEFYDDGMTDQGWDREASVNSEGTSMLSNTKGENTCTVWVIEEDDEITVTITAIIK